MEFTKLVETVKSFNVRNAPCSERELEDLLSKYLKEKGVMVERQQIAALGRTDLLIRTWDYERPTNVVIEIKLTADISCVKQLDRYGSMYDGLILICWTASSTLKRIFTQVKQTAKIPVEIVEVRNACRMI